MNDSKKGSPMITSKKLSLRTFTILFITSISALLIDQLTKILAVTNLPLHTPVPVCPFFNLFLTYNKGVSFSLFSNDNPATPIYLSLMGLVICFLVLYWMVKENDFLIRIGLAYILGGAIGNIIDRIRLGYVIDFLDVYYKTNHWPAFNGADSFICLGAFIIFIRIFFTKEGDKK